MFSWCNERFFDIVIAWREELQLSDESGFVSATFYFCSTFLATAVSLLGKLRHILAKWPGLLNDKHLLVLSNLHSLDLCPVLPKRKHFPCSLFYFVVVSPVLLCVVRQQLACSFLLVV